MHLSSYVRTGGYSFDAKLHTGYVFETTYPVMVLVSDPQTTLNIDEQL